MIILRIDPIYLLAGLLGLVLVITRESKINLTGDQRCNSTSCRLSSIVNRIATCLHTVELLNYICWVNRPASYEYLARLTDLLQVSFQSCCNGLPADKSKLGFPRLQELHR